MKKHKTKIIITLVILTVLTGAWFMGSPQNINPVEEETIVKEIDEPEEPVFVDESFTVTLSVRVDTLLFNMHLLDSEKHELVPPSGAIFPATQVQACEGESVFDVLQREMRSNGIHMASRFTPIYGSAYVEAIHNLYEFDAGPLSGWVYRVNGLSPGFGSSLYILQAGDIVEWMYTIDLGRDIGLYVVGQ